MIYDYKSEIKLSEWFGVDGYFHRNMVDDSNEYCCQHKWTECPVFFPKLVIGILFVIGGQLVFKSIILKSDVVKELNIMRELAVLLYGAGLCLYIFMLDKIGFLISSILVSIITLTLMKAKKKKYYIIQILIVIAVYFIFTKLLSVNLP